VSSFSDRAVIWLSVVISRRRNERYSKYVVRYFLPGCSSYGLETAKRERDDDDLVSE
jgi:hypothetical protein